MVLVELQAVLHPESNKDRTVCDWSTQCQGQEVPPSENATSDTPDHHGDHQGTTPGPSISKGSATSQMDISAVRGQVQVLGMAGKDLDVYLHDLPADANPGQIPTVAIPHLQPSPVALRGQYQSNPLMALLHSGPCTILTVKA